MTASNSERKNVEEHLPQDLLRRLYLDSRVSIKQLATDFGISHHTLSRYLKEYEDRYSPSYTVDVDTNLLGFSDARIIAIKFEKVPDVKLLKEVLEKNPFIQDAYLASGDFDLILYVIGLDCTRYNDWLYKFRLGFCHYNPKVKFVTLNHLVEGFIPIRNKLIYQSCVISNSEKKILAALVDNSRIRLNKLAKTTKLSQMKIIYTIKKLQKKRIIKKFTTCVQHPDKKLPIFYSVTITPNEEHHPTLLLKLLDKIIGGEGKKDATSDYAVVCDTSGHFDALFFCNFNDGTVLNDRGPEFLRKAWESEHPIIEQCILTGLIVGRWPFNSNNYVKWGEIMKEERTKPIRFEVYK